MSWTVIVLLISFGFLALVLELLIVSGGVVGIVGLLAMISGVIGAYSSRGAMAGTITLLITLVLATVQIVLILRSRTWKKCELETEIDVKMNDFDPKKIYVGAVGITAGRLAPSGKAVFNGETIEVVSPQNFIDQNQEVVITEIEGRKIFVKLNH